MENFLIEHPQSQECYKFDIEPQKSIRLYGTRYGKAFDLTFKIGDRAEYDSYNLTYVGTITKIGHKTVTIQHYPDQPKVSQLKLYTFAWRNYDFDAERIAHDNAIESMYI